MSNPPQPSANIAYDPLPLTNEESNHNSLYNAPPSPDPRISSFHTPQMVPHELGPDESFIPPGAAQPRFLGAASYDGPGTPSFRDSFASSHQSLPGGAQSDYGSVYALNDGRNSGRFESAYRDEPRASYYNGDNVPMSPVGHSRILEEKRAVYAPPRAKSRRKIIILGVIVALILIIVAVVVPLYFTVFKSKNSSGGTKDGSSENDPEPTSSASDGGKVNAVVTGSDGSTITTEDGTTFTYRNPFGGQWYWDPNDPFNNGAKAQSWSPALNETFQYGTDKIKGVNLGGWLNTEPFMQVKSPALFEPYLTNAQPAVDEWTLSQAMAADTANGGLTQLENHYKTFITEKDFAEIAGAGLNFVRIPIGFWAIETRGNEPFLAKVSWTYFLKAIKWARKYGIRINLDLHSLPGSQNGWNHSGRLGTVGFLNGPMGYANAQRSLDYIRIFAEFISQPQYKDVVTIFGIINEPQGSVVGKDQLTRFYWEAYTIIRGVTGTGAGKGPYVGIHDGFYPRDQWADTFPNADRITLDSHPYLCFNGQSSNPMSSYATTPCTSWGSAVNTSMANFGLTNAGEFSNAVTDCGLWLNGVNLGTRYEGTYAGDWPRVGSCTPWTDWQNYDRTMKDAIKTFALASMDALQDYFFWTWKIGNSSVTGKVETPAWSYQLGYENDWMPKDPREAIGACGNANPWSPPLQAWQTGGSGAGNVPASVSAAFAWPPPSISNGGVVTALPSYTPTGPIPTLTATSVTAADGERITKTADAGNGWANPQDTQGVFVEIPGCSYLDPWVSPAAVPPSPLCSGAARRAPEPAPQPLITPPPS